MISTAYAVLSLAPGRAAPRTSLGAPRSAVLSMQEVAYVSPTGKALESAEIMTECLLLPKEAYPGSPPVSIVGEVMLQELEDDEETRTQLFFKSDGTIGHGSTDGPPPAGFCGLWQCGEKQFQMTLSRAFSSPSATLSPEQQGGMESDIAYTVVRVYEGTVDAESKGVALLNGRIDLLSDSDVAAWAGSDASSIAALDPFNIDVPPVGYFVIDAGTSYDQETGDGATARSNLKA